MTIQDLAKAFVAKLQPYVGNTPEDQGSNRSKIIDEFNRRAGEDMGEPYCIAGATCVFDDTCKELGLSNPVGIHAGTQEFWQNAPSKYKHDSTFHAVAGMIGIYQDRGNHDHGHGVSVVADMVFPFKTFQTIEFNTNTTGGREGDNCYARQRSVDGTTEMRLLGFVDVCQWVMDYNQSKQTVVQPQESGPGNGQSIPALDWEKNHPEWYQSEQETNEYTSFFIETDQLQPLYLI